jgi:dTDP-3-amino-3,4,6-trideoxy-alpha-D-glucose transaminase
VNVPFVDFKSQLSGVRIEIEAAVARVLDSGFFILGPEGRAFERELAQTLGAREAVAVANGTDALQLALRVLGVGPGDEVITSAISAAFTVLAIEQAGARPVLVDVEPANLTIDPSRVAAAITPRTRAIVPVHLYGHPARMDALLELADRHGLALLEDACQAHGALFEGRPVGTMRGERGIGALSFYPTKNLGALGDGGAVLVNDGAWAARLRQLRNGGQTNRYRHESFGLNSRLDELQAAILRVGLRHLAAWTERRRELAALYLRELAGAPLELPQEQPWARTVYHLFVVRHPRRDALATALEARGVGTLVHYPIPLHLQPAFAGLGGRPGDCPVAEKACGEILSLPLHPGLREEQVRAVAAAVHDAARALC